TKMRNHQVVRPFTISIGTSDSIVLSAFCVGWVERRPRRATHHSDSAAKPTIPTKLAPLSPASSSTRNPPFPRSRNPPFRLRPSSPATLVFVSPDRASHRFTQPITHSTGDHINRTQRVRKENEANSPRGANPRPTPLYADQTASSR